MIKKSRQRMTRIICLIICLATVICCMSAPASAADDRIYAVDGGWNVNYGYSGEYSFPSDVQSLNSPIVHVKENLQRYMYFHTPYIVSSGSHTIYGRFTVSSLDSSFDFTSDYFGGIYINSYWTNYKILDGCVYFYASSADFLTSTNDFLGELVINFNLKSGIPLNVAVQLDYVYDRVNSFVPLTGSVSGNNISLGQSIDCSFSGSGYVDTDGVSWADNTYLQSNTWETNVYVPLVPYAMVLTDAVLELDLYFNSGVVVGYQIEDDLSNNYYALMQVSSSFLDTQTNVYNKYTVHTSGSHMNVLGWSGTVTPGTSGLYDISYSESHFLQEQFTQRLSEQLTYDTCISGQDQSSCRLLIDLSSFPESGSGLYIQLYVVGDANYSVPSYSVSRLGYFIQGADAMLGEEQTIIDSVKSFFDHGISSLVSTISDAARKIVDALNPQSSDTSAGDTLVNQGQQIQDFEHEHQAVINQGTEVMTNTLNISGFAPALLFVSSTLDGVFDILGPYQVVIIIPVVVGMILFVCSKAPGNIRPGRSSPGPKRVQRDIKED